MRNKKREQIIKTVLSIILIGVGILNIFPFLFMLSASVKPLNEIFTYPISLIPKTFMWKNYTQLFSSQYSFVQWYWNTGVMVTITICIKVFVVTIAAYAFARLEFKGRDVVFLILLSAMMVPPEAMIIPKYILFKFLGITNTMWSLILPSVFDVFFVFLMRQFFMEIPKSLSEAAIIDGCGHFRIYLKIVMPLSKAAVFTMILFTFIWGWNDYMGPYIFITDTSKQMLSVGIKMFQISNAVNYSLQMAATTLVLIPIILLFIFCQKYFIEGIATTGVKE